MAGATSPLVASGSPARRDRPLKRLPQILCGFFIFLYALFFAYRALMALLYPYPLQYGEGAVFYEAGQLFGANFDPANLYPSNAAPPYRAAIYSPLNYYFQAITMFITGPRSMLGGRLITVLASLYICYSLYRIARQQELATVRRAGVGISLAAALTPFATAALYDWGVLAKADMLAIAFSLAGVQRIWEAGQARRRDARLWPYFGAGLLCALALLTKQSALAAPIAIVIWLGLGREWRFMAAFVGSLAGSLVVVGVGFQLATGGAFFRHLVTYNSQPYDLDFLGAALNYLLWTHIVMLVLAAFWVARPLVGRFERMDLWRIYFLAALAVSFSAGKVGADYNYYIESLCLMSLLAWWQVGRLMALRSEWRLGPVRLPVAMIALVFMVIQLFQLHHIPLLAEGSNTPTPADFDRPNQVAAQLRDLSQQGPLLAEDSGWQATQGLPVELDDPFVFGQLAPAGSWDSRAFMEKLNSGYFRSAFFEISQPDMSEAALDKAVADGTASPFPRRFAPEVEKILLDRTKFTPAKRIGRWLFLTWKA